MYIMDPCRKNPIPYNMPTIDSMHYQMPIIDPMPYYQMPMHYQMPSCPMMNPMFRDCVQACMMQCGNCSNPYPMPMEYPINSNPLPNELR